MVMLVSQVTFMSKLSSGERRERFGARGLHIPNKDSLFSGEPSGLPIEFPNHRIGPFVVSGVEFSDLCRLVWIPTPHRKAQAIGSEAEDGDEMPGMAEITSSYGGTPKNTLW